MSTEIDQRVVQMKFNNASFEKNAAQSLLTLERLKTALSFKGAEKGLTDLQKAVGQLDLSSIGNATEKIGVKFDAMSIVAISAINRIVNSAMTAGENILKSLTIDPPSTGFTKYEEKTKAVVTIMNATGKSIGEVNEHLDRLNKFTDETSYNFTDMVANIGKFTSNNVPLEQAVNAMQGIANLAAISGQGINEASRAMYNFAQAVSVGSVKLMDWRSIQNANMATSEFKQTIIDTALEIGTLKKSSDGLTKTLKGTTVSATNFEEALSEGWFSSEVLLKSLDKYGSYATEVIALMEKESVDCATAMKMLGGDMDSLGARAFRAAQEAKTFTDAIEATKDAVSTGWSRTFEIIFGNYEEAKELWTGLTTELYNIFAASAESRNELLQEWKDLGGRTELLDGIKKAWEDVKDIMGIVRKAAEEVFPPLTAEKLKAITDKVKELAQNLKLSEEAAYSLKVAVKVVLVPLKLLVQALGVLAYVGFNAIKIIFKIGDALLSLAAGVNPLEGWMRKVMGDERYNRIARATTSILLNMSTAFERLNQKISRFTDRFKDAEGNFVLFEKFGKIASIVGNVTLDGLVAGLEALANINFDSIEKFAGPVLKQFKMGLANVKSFLSPVTNGVKNLIEMFKNSAPEKRIDIVIEAIGRAKTAIVNFIKSIPNGDLFAKFEEKFPGAAEAFKKLGDAILDFVQKLSPSKILIFSFGVALVAMVLQWVNVLNALKGAISNIGGVFSTINAILKGFGKSHPLIMQLAKAIAILTASLAILSQIDPEKLKNATISLVTVMAVFGVIAGGMAAIDKFVVKDGAKFEQMALALVGISGSIMLLATAMKLLSTIRLDKSIFQTLGVVSVLMAEMAGLAFLMGRKKLEFTKNILFFLAFATSINQIVKALKKLDDVKLNNVPGVIAALGIIMTALGVLAISIQKINLQNSVGVTLMIMDLLLMTKVLQQLAKVDARELLGAVNAFVPLVGAIGVLFLSTRLAGKYAASAGKYILAVSIAMLILGQALKNISAIGTSEEIQSATNSVAAMLLLFGVITGVSHFAGDTKGLGKTILAMSGAILLLGLAVNYLGGLDEKIATRGIAIVSGFLLMFAIIMKVGSSAQKAAPSIAAMTVAIGLIASSLALMTLLDPKELMITSASLSAALLSFGMAMYGISKVLGSGGNGFKNVVKTLILLTGMIAPIALVFKMLKDIDGKNAIQQAVALSAVIATLAIVAKSISVLKIKSNSVKTLAILGLVLIEAATTLALLDNLKTDGLNLIGKATALGLTMLVVGKAVEIITNMKLKTNCFKVLGILGLVLIEASLALAILDTLTTDSIGLIGKAAALSLIMMSLAGATAIMSNLKVNANMIQTFVVLGLALIEATAALAILDKFTNADGLIVKATALSEVLFAMSIVTGILSVLGAGGGASVTGAVSGAIALAAVIAVIGTVMAAAGALMENEKVLNAVQNGVSFFTKVGEAIGGLIGGVVGGIVTGAMQNLPTVGQSLADFMTNATPFFNGVSAITVEKLKSVTSLADAVKTMASVNVGNLDTNLSTIGEQLEEFGPHMRTFALSLAGIDPETVTASASAAKSLAEFNAALPQRDGKLDSWFGKKDMAEFGEDLSIFGLYFSQYSKYAEGINSEAVLASASAGQALANLNDSLPQRDGILDQWIGKKDLADFGADLVDFGMYLARYSFYAERIDADAVLTSADVGQALANLNDSLPQRDGKLDSWFGKKDLGDFGADLVVFGSYMSQYSDYAKTVDESIVKKTQDIADALAILVSVTPTEGGFFTKIFGGDKDFESFSNGLKGIVDAISTLTASIDVTQFHDLGARIVFQLSSGILDNMHLATSAIDEVAKEMIATTQDRLEIQSPSRKFYTIGGYIVQGLANGLKNHESVASKAMTYLASNLLTKIKSFFGIHSPSIVMRDEVGSYLVKGIADGITNDMSAEQAADKKAQNIVSAFQSALEKYSISINTADLEYKLWEGLNSDTVVESMKAQKQQEMLTKKLEAQGQRVNLAQAEYNATLQALGESSQKTQEAYNKWLQEQITLTDLAKQMTETVTTVSSVKEDLFVEYAKLLGDNRADLQKLGFTDEEIESWASDKLGGYYPGQVAENATKSLEDGFNKTDVKSIVDYFTNQVSVELDYSLTDAIQNGGKSAASAGTAVGENVSNNIAEGIESKKDEVTNKITDMLGDAFGINFDPLASNNSVANMVNGFVTAIDEKGVTAIAAVKNWAGGLLGGFNEMLGIASPSKKFEESGECIVEGLANGIEKSPNPAINSAEKIGQDILNALSLTPNNIDISNQKTSKDISAAADAGRKLIEEFGIGIKSQEDLIYIQVNEFISNILNAILAQSSYYNAAGAELGTKLMDGLLLSIQSKRSSIVNEMRSIAEEAIESANSILNAVGASTSAAKDNGVHYSSGGGGGGGSSNKKEKERYMLVGETIESLAEVISSDTTSTDAKATLELAKSIENMAETASEISKTSKSNSASMSDQNTKEITINNNFTQNNNSPKALTRTEVYTRGRDAKSLFAQTVNEVNK